MAFPLAQINLNIPAAFIQNGVITVLGIHVPPAPANPPTPVDIRNAVKLKAQVIQHLLDGSVVSDEVVEAVVIYESEIVLAHQIALATGPAAAALPPGPLAGVVQRLHAINQMNKKLEEIHGSLKDLQRDTAINDNMRRGAGVSLPYIEVLFQDGTRPTVAIADVPAQGGQPAIAGRPALPLLNSLAAVQKLTTTQIKHYLTGYGIPAPRPLTVGRAVIGYHIGSIAD
ncbi:hypothetical protein GGX14DRAFT_396149 [Mycena pura]|uniref:Mug135-like C-terminal domain-containing protein n=1 Tax=Mycena pura TaxID=153505 RepID=A0AAD6VF31_9AGAR|nr:hypothetical protein GGX14DRAFT_396149 [Mycena pura]